MKRDPALASLSHDHHQALVVAQKLRRTTAQTADEAREAFATYWRTDGSAHFRQEEELLLPAYAAYGDSHHLVVARVLCEHVDIRRRAAELASSEPASVGKLQALGTTMAHHVRLEERVLFPLIERAVPPAQLAELALALSGEQPSE